MTTMDPFADAPTEMKELAAFFNEYNKESDRGAVLVAASRLDDLLKSILSAYLRDTETTKNLLHGFNAPLSGFAARAAAAHALGLIEDHEFEEITLIRKIRNELGHKWRDIGFDADEVKKLCAKLPWLGPDVPQDQKTARGTFNFVVVILLTDLMWRQRLALQEKRVARTWPNKTRGVRA